MSKTVIILFVACAGLGLLSLHLVNQMRAGQAKITELQAQIANLERQQQTPAPPPPALDPVPTVQQFPPPPPAPTKEVVLGMSAKRPPPATAAVAFAAPRGEDHTRLIREARERQRQLMQDPEYREAMRIQQRSNIGRHYPGVAQELGLTTDQTEQLFDLLAEQQVRNSEQAELMWDTEGVDPATLQQRQEKMQQQWQETARKNDAELAAQFGPDKLQAWKEYQSTLGYRHQAEQLRSTLAGRGVSLSDDANRAVVKAYGEAQKAEMQEYANMARTSAAGYAVKGNVAMLSHIGPAAEMQEKQLENTKKRNQRVLEALSTFLTYEQREALEKEQEAELKMLEAQMRMMRAQSKIDGGNNGGWVSNSVQGIIVPHQP